MEKSMRADGKRVQLNDEELGQVTGGMGMNLSFCTCAAPRFDDTGKCKTCGKPMRSGFFRTPGAPGRR